MDRQQHDRKEARTGNMRLASCGVTVVNSSAVFQINFSAGLTVLCPEIPHERQAQTVSGQCKNTADPQMAHLVLQTHKQTLKKPKEPFFANAPTRMKTLQIDKNRNK